jgi:hypothetical protein
MQTLQRTWGGTLPEGAILDLKPLDPATVVLTGRRNGCNVGWKAAIGLQRAKPSIVAMDGDITLLLVTVPSGDLWT